MDNSYPFVDCSHNPEDPSVLLNMQLMDKYLVLLIPSFYHIL